MSLCAYCKALRGNINHRVRKSPSLRYPARAGTGVMIRSGRRPPRKRLRGEGRAGRRPRDGAPDTSSTGEAEGERGGKRERYRVGGWEREKVRERGVGEGDGETRRERGSEKQFATMRECERERLHNYNKKN